MSVSVAAKGETNKADFDFLNNSINTKIDYRRYNKDMNWRRFTLHERRDERRSEERDAKQQGQVNCAKAMVLFCYP